MICPVCNKPYPCAHSRGDQGANSSQSGVRPPSAPSVEAKTRSDLELWRQEVALRVRQHRARRGRYDPSTSLHLEFPSDAALAMAPERDLSTAALSESKPVFSLPIHEPELHEPESQPAEHLTISESSYESQENELADAEPDASPPKSSPRKIIRFPRYSAVEPVIVQRPSIQEMELAEPAPEAPRILDAPEPEAAQMELLPSFADIRLDEPTPAVDLCQELESAPKPAPLSRRLASGAVDSGIVLFAAGLFAVIFVQIVETVPTGRSTLLFTVAVGATLWTLFHYLFLVYGAATPGMRATQLKLFRFNGRRPSRMIRGVRALASTLSAVALGLGFAWALVDEDALCWHDRISQTYMKSSS